MQFDTSIRKILFIEIYIRKSKYNYRWHISDFGFCDPVDKPLEIMWIGKLPFADFDHDYDFAMKSSK
ncbi:7870_t:CDS:2 [Funneliformis geosporum]|uniref:7870_t:CDS:1 n=1 Tax=Funneliformis geosporum TaxID=1117311 RepID=A0A9W4SG19_9GLOM|nr:7870_t:CDS:2 [Funneliformis geosporum]